MSIELRIDNTGVGRIVVACIHCGWDVVDPGDGLAVWAPGREPDPVEGAVFCVEYAHRECEEHFLEGLGRPEVSVATNVNMPLEDLFEMLRQPLAARHDDPNDREA